MESKTSENGHPVWWTNTINVALPVLKRDHGVAESLLGIAQIIESGNLQEARRVAMQLVDEISIITLMPKVVGELNSTQLKRMMEDESYPQYIKDRISTALDLKDSKPL